MSDRTLITGIVVALVLGAVVGYVLYPTKPLAKEPETQQEAPLYSTSLRLDDLEQQIHTIQWRNGGTFFMALASLCLGVWNYFRGLSGKVRK